MEKQVKQRFIELRQDRARKAIIGAIMEVIVAFVCVFYSTTHPELPALLHTLCKTAMIAATLSLPLIALNFIQSKKNDYEKAQLCASANIIFENKGKEIVLNTFLDTVSKNDTPVVIQNTDELFKDTNE